MMLGDGGGDSRSCSDFLRAFTSHGSKSLLHAVILLLKVPFTLSVTKAVPPGFSSCVSGGDGSGYSV